MSMSLSSELYLTAAPRRLPGIASPSQRIVTLRGVEICRLPTGSLAALCKAVFVIATALAYCSGVGNLIIKRFLLQTMLFLGPRLQRLSDSFSIVPRRRLTERDLRHIT